MKVKLSENSISNIWQFFVSKDVGKGIGQGCPSRVPHAAQHNNECGPT